jgi:PAS domain S-box-containing protein
MSLLHSLPKAPASGDPFEGAGQHSHVVQFYDSDEFLGARVVSFLRVGVRQGEPVVLITTPDHCSLFTGQLSGSGIDVDAACRNGRLTLLDARDTLAKFMIGGMPDWHRFKTVVGGVIERALAASSAPRVRTYGEMVDVLWRDGNPKAAIRLEEFWNDLSAIHSFSLLCAYRMGNFYKEADSANFQHICQTHTHVVPAESYPDTGEEGVRLREVSMLQQRAKALETEISHRKELEEALRNALRDLRSSEDALRRSEQQLKDFVENAAEGLHWVGADGIVQWANKAELEMLGYTAEEYIGRSITEFHADPKVIQDILARLSRNETLRDYEARLRCKDGSILHAMINSNVYFEDGQFKHTRCFTRDVTARKQMELKLREAEEERARLFQLEKAARIEAEAASMAKDEFLAMLGHELRNPLSPIVTALQLMRLRGDNSAPKERAVIERQVKHLVRLVDDLLDVSRITRGKIELHREPIEIAEVIAKAVEMSSPLLEQRAHQLTVNVPRGRGLRVEADPARLAQVFSNLLANAAKYTDSGGRIEVAATRAGNTIRVRVSDNGAGIDARLMPHIFDLFIQAKQTLDRSQGGLGIGLTIVRNLVELHDGTVSAHSDGLGRGSEFVVELPAMDRAVSSRPAEPHPGSDPRETPQRHWRSLRVLVVDDNEDAGMMVTEALQDMGYEARQAGDGPSALLAAAQFRPHAAVLDIGLPVMDGYELGRRLGAAHAGIRLIALTGYGQQSDRRLSTETGFLEHLVKPLSLERLAELLDRMDKALEAATPGLPEAGQ